MRNQVNSLCGKKVGSPLGSDLASRHHHVPARPQANPQSYLIRVGSGYCHSTRRIVVHPHQFDLVRTGRKRGTAEPDTVPEVDTRRSKGFATLRISQRISQVGHPVNIEIVVLVLTDLDN